MKIDIDKNDFLINELWIMSFSAGFQRANVYRGNISTDERTKFRKDVKAIVEKRIVGLYKIRQVDGEEHGRIMQEICDEISRKWGDILRNGRFRIGICQKLLNLQLKYLWCMGMIPRPPHCPIDRTVILKLNLDHDINWTEIEDIDSYNRIIAKINNRAKEERMSIAEWELKEFKRRE